MFGVRLLLGAETNILDYHGTLSLDNHHMDYCDICIAGIHKYCYTNGSIKENAAAVIDAIKNPRVDVISHPDDSRTPLDYKQVVQAAKDYNTLLEVNNNSLRHPESRKNVAQNTTTMLELCEKANIPVLISSDAHFYTDIANFSHVWPVLAGAGFPEHLIINYNQDKFLDFIAENKRAVPQKDM